MPVPADEARKHHGGTYILIVSLDHEMVLTIGRTGAHLFPAGTYAYCGSAQANLEARVRRHFSKDKKKHWHIDYLLDAADPVCAFLIDGEHATECLLSQLVSSMPGSSMPMPGFGSSDCHCQTHLFHIDEDQIPAIKESLERINDGGGDH